ncbi:hypothetical protein [Heliophilum fasciatum]|uniref:Uncharacterized protein n=1 Tax=Heliophilum fasciatum TaxID=35700 RepID=A0A4R2RCC2_9FIRM|nr:hypothetical protein [Heliophilum fasciatum]MCW2279161.1 hypothetical protein [Heliophilum fasciatum]TCP61020.1 hypothetical protein EDD73_13115 [Heliophilum fasciatum]
MKQQSVTPREAEILDLLDRLIDEASQVSMLAGPDQEMRMTEGIRLIERIASLCIELLDGREEYLEATLRQLIQQKLPSQTVLRSFGEFQTVIDAYVLSALHRYTQMPKMNEFVEQEQFSQLATVQPEKTEMVPSLPETVMELVDLNECITQTVRKIYPGIAIERGTPDGRNPDAVFLPTKRIALVGQMNWLTSANESLNGTSSDLQTSQGYRLILVAREDAHSPSRIQRAIVRARK